MNDLPTILFIGLLLGGATSFGLSRRPRLQGATAILGAASAVFVAALLFAAASTGERFVHTFGGWASPLGIVFVLDRLSSIFLFLSTVLLFVTLLILWIRAWSSEREDNDSKMAARSTPLLFLLGGGLVGAFLTGDLFNLFVMFELVLVASYLLLIAPGRRGGTVAGFPVVAINLAASVLFFIGVGAIYAVFGSVNLADIAAQSASSAVTTSAPAPTSTTAAYPLVDVGAFCLLLAFATKAAFVPFLAWLPMSYPYLHGTVAAFFAGMMTKLGVYAFLRITPLLDVSWLPTALVVVGATSSLLGVLAALAQFDLRRLLGFHIVSQVGYMILGLGLSTWIGLAGAIFYLIHHVLVKASLFLFADELERESGESDLHRMRTKRVAMAVLFCLPAFSLAGIPPFSGFLAKIGLFRATLDSGSWVLTAILVLASFGTLASMLKIWRYAFSDLRKGERGEDRKVDQTTGPGRKRPSMWQQGPQFALAALSLVVAFGGGQVWKTAGDTATQLQDVDGYIEAVFGVGGRGADVLSSKSTLETGQSETRNPASWSHETATRYPASWSYETETRSPASWDHPAATRPARSPR